MFSYYAIGVPEFTTKIQPLVRPIIIFPFTLSSEAAHILKILRLELTSAFLACTR